MALIDCTECGHRVSDKAASCPGCGMRLNVDSAGAGAAAAAGSVPQPQPRTRSVGILLFLGIAVVPVVFVWFLLRKGHSTLARVLGFAWLGLTLALALVDTPDSVNSGSDGVRQEAQTQRSATREVEVLEVSAAQLASAYDRNTVAADQKYKGKRLKVTGVVDSINTDLFGNPYITMRGGVNQFMEPQFKLSRQYSDYAARLAPGMRVTLICTGRGDVIKTPMSDNCVPAG